MIRGKRLVLALIAVLLLAVLVMILAFKASFNPWS
jgi:hypothetical protein